MKKLSFCLVLIAISLCGVLGACGVKPGHVSAPEGSQLAYPASYPKAADAE